MTTLMADTIRTDGTRIIEWQVRCYESIEIDEAIISIDTDPIIEDERVEQNLEDINLAQNKESVNQAQDTTITSTKKRIDQLVPRINVLHVDSLAKPFAAIQDPREFLLADHTSASVNAETLSSFSSLEAPNSVDGLPLNTSVHNQWAKETSLIDDHLANVDTISRLTNHSAERIMTATLYSPNVTAVELVTSVQNMPESTSSPREIFESAPIVFVPDTVAISAAHVNPPESSPQVIPTQEENSQFTAEVKAVEQSRNSLLTEHGQNVSLAIATAPIAEPVLSDAQNVEQVRTVSFLTESTMTSAAEAVTFVEKAAMPVADHIDQSTPEIMSDLAIDHTTVERTVTTEIQLDHGQTFDHSPGNHTLEVLTEQHRTFEYPAVKFMQAELLVIENNQLKPHEMPLQQWLEQASHIAGGNAEYSEKIVIAEHMVSVLPYLDETLRSTVVQALDHPAQKPVVLPGRRDPQGFLQDITVLERVPGGIRYDFYEYKQPVVERQETATASLPGVTATLEGPERAIDTATEQDSQQSTSSVRRDIDLDLVLTTRFVEPADVTHQNSRPSSVDEFRTATMNNEPALGITPAELLRADQRTYSGQDIADIEDARATIVRQRTAVGTARRAT